MSDVLQSLLATLAKQNAPTLGALIGTAVGGPAGAALGGVAGKAIEVLADALGVEPTPSAVAEAATQPGAAEVIAKAEQTASQEHLFWQAQLALNAKQAESPSMFVAGARPAMMWACTIGLLLSVTAYPMLSVIAWTRNLPPPTFPDPLRRL